MEYACLIQKDSALAESVKALIQTYSKSIRPARIDVAMAYVTVAGVREALSFLPDTPEQSRWVFGLDDGVTQPGAIDLCTSWAHASVRVAALADTNRRFHPKVLYLHTQTPAEAFMMIGSANLTKRALCGNAESVVVLRAENAEDRRELDRLWNEAWGLGHAATDRELEDYRAEYEAASRSRRRLRRRRGNTPAPTSRRTTVVLESDAAEIDPSQADTCWIECGNVTAMGRELEFKAEQGLFFGLDPHGEPPRTLQFIVSDGTQIDLRLKYQENHMWRLQLTREVPEVLRGLRPRNADGSLGRSPWVAVFERTDIRTTFIIRFVRLNSREHLRLRRLSHEHGTCGSTTAREYGWY
ncbi:MAG: phospholipase D-like domain-containing protein [Phycisphaerales bacterium JB040]